MSIHEPSLYDLLEVDTRQSGNAEGALESAPLVLEPGERLALRVFVDKTVVEVFANGRQAIARRLYPSRSDSLGVRLIADRSPVHVHSFDAWHIHPSNAW